MSTHTHTHTHTHEGNSPTKKDCPCSFEEWQKVSLCSLVEARVAYGHGFPIAFGNSACASWQGQGRLFNRGRTLRALFSMLSHILPTVFELCLSMAVRSESTRAIKHFGMTGHFAHHDCEAAVDEHLRTNWMWWQRLLSLRVYGNYLIIFITKSRKFAWICLYGMWTERPSMLEMSIRDTLLVM